EIIDADSVFGKTTFLPAVAQMCHEGYDNKTYWADILRKYKPGTRCYVWIGEEQVQPAVVLETTDRAIKVKLENKEEDSEVHIRYGDVIDRHAFFFPEGVFESTSPHQPEIHYDSVIEPRKKVNPNQK